MKLKLSIILLLFFLLVYSCIEPFDFNIKGDKSKSLVVEGLITNEPGPYFVYLTRTTDYSSTIESIEVVEGANVIISDDLGNSETLTETRPGIYETKPDSIQGIQGRSYKVIIETPDGKQYESKPELLSSVPEIDSIYYEFQEKQTPDGTPDNFINVYIDTSTPENGGNFFLLKWHGIYEVFTQPEDYIYREAPAPKPCCAQCWVSEYNTDLIIVDDKYVIGNKIEKQKVISIPANSRYFSYKYYAIIEQLSLTKKAYDYYDLTSKQINYAGSFFEPPPAFIKGNIQNILDPKDHVFGYFGASSITKTSIFIPRSAVPYYMGPWIMPDDCRTISNSTTVRPSFW
ncbi:MAG: DUF4249 domain-containing protein [Bacteroidetes bacterium]|nr:DUF4249 domain-containing protein [Bacteroidota bacterium]